MKDIDLLSQQCLDVWYDVVGRVFKEVLTFDSRVIDFNWLAGQNEIQEEEATFPNHLFVSRLWDPDESLFKDFVDFVFVDIGENFEHDFIDFYDTLITVDKRSA